MMLNFAAVACTIFLVLFGILAITHGNYAVGITDFVAVFIILLTFYYYKKYHNYLPLSYVINIVLGLLFLYLLFTSGIDYSGPLWSFIIPVSVIFMLGRIEGLIFTFIYILIVSILFIFDIPRELYTINFKLRFVGSFTGVTITSYYIELVREKMNRLLNEKNLDLINTVVKLEKKEKELKEKELHYRSLFESSNDALFLMKGENFIDCNPKTLEIFDCNKKDIINHSPIKFSPKLQPDGRLSSEKSIEKINSVLHGKPQFFEWVHTKLDGTEFYAEVNLNLINHDGSKIIQASVRDISSRKLVEVELKKAKDEAEKSDRLKSDFLAQMSHEIRTPINTIMNYTALLKMEVEDIVSEDNAGSFNSIQNAAIRLLRTIDLILNISDLEAGSYDPKFEENDLIKDIIAPVISEFEQAALNKKLTISFANEIEVSPITVFDNYTVYQTVVNLVDNAIKYTDHGNIGIGIKSKENNYIVEITDTGVGISKEYIPNLFDKFSQEDCGYTRRYEGNGLGLALVKKYCEINSISIEVESKKGVYTTFRLTIPIISKK